MPLHHRPLVRLARLAALLLATLAGAALTFGAPRAHAAPHFASGIKVGETTDHSAIVWVRLTQHPAADPSVLADSKPSDADTPWHIPAHAVPGTPGQARIRFAPAAVHGASPGARPGPGAWDQSPWHTVTADTNFTHQFTLTHLQPDTAYHFEAQARDHADTPDHVHRPNHLTGQFRTAPAPGQQATVRFALAACQSIRSINNPVDGHHTYRRISTFDPHFFVHTGDILYYDHPPLAKNRDQARAKWDLMFAYRDNHTFHRNIATYFMKDDHDTLKNDSWPGQTYGDLTFQQGLDIFREQVPMGEKTYRTQRWGRDVQVWMLEGRDYRTPNPRPDGPDKTLLGAEQKAWLLRTVADSDATFKFVVFPGPVVGPDKPRKSDNHANPAYAHEGAQLRHFLAKQANTYVICGDRHWQYCSVDPDTGLTELGTGSINDQHTFGGHPQEDPTYHRYFSPRGGFLGLTVQGHTATAQWFSGGPLDPATGQPQVLHTETFQAQAP